MGHRSQSVLFIGIDSHQDILKHGSICPSGGGAADFLMIIQYDPLVSAAIRLKECTQRQKTRQEVVEPRTTNELIQQANG